MPPKFLLNNICCVPNVIKTLHSLVPKAYMHLRLTLKELQEAAVLHELSDDVYRLLQRADRVQLDQLGMAQLLHDVRLRQEVLGVHRACKAKEVNTSMR